MKNVAVVCEHIRRQQETTSEEKNVTESEEQGEEIGEKEIKGNAQEISGRKEKRIARVDENKGNMFTKGKKHACV